MTLKEIAEMAEVSQGTVDRVLHNRGKVSKKTKERILKILKEVDYQPNMYARGLVLNKTITIAAIIPKYDKGEYWEIPALGIDKAIKDFSHFGIRINKFSFDQNDIESFSSSAKSLLESKPDGVIIAPVINFEAVKLCARLRNQEIPFALIDSDIKNSGARSFIGQDAIQSGRLASKLLSTSVNGRGKIAIVSIKNNENHNDTLRKRIEGFKSFLLESDFLENVHLEEVIIDQRNSSWQQQLENYLLSKKPNGIYVPSSKVHFVAEILQSNRFKTKLVGNDLIEHNLPFIESGIIEYVIGQRPETQGYLSVENLYKVLVTKQSIEEKNYLPLDIITKENLQYYNNRS